MVFKKDTRGYLLITKKNIRLFILNAINFLLPKPPRRVGFEIDSAINFLPMTNGGINSGLCLKSTFMLIPMRDTMRMYISFVTSSNIYTNS